MIDTGLDLFAVSEPQKITKQGGGLALRPFSPSSFKFECELDGSILTYPAIAR